MDIKEQIDSKLLDRILEGKESKYLILSIAAYRKLLGEVQYYGYGVAQNPLTLNIYDGLQVCILTSLWLQKDFEGIFIDIK